jgi:hypothetical protein
MTYQVSVGEDGRLLLSEELVREIGFAPGDVLAIEPEGGMLRLRRERATDRLREVLRGYSVDEFLADRRADGTA